MKKQKYRQKQSFTLIELLVVIAIIAILAAVIVANVTSAQAQARDVRRTQDLDQLKTALEMYYLNNDKYPHTTNSDQGFCIEESQDFKEDLVDGDYISSIPQDPLYDIDQCSNPFNTDCHCYIYRTETEDKYKLFAKTEQQDFKPATQDGGVSTTYYEAYAPVQGANKIGYTLGWYDDQGQYYYCGLATVTFTYNNQQVTYGTVAGSNNDECWLDRNLGADPHTDPSQYTGPTDSRGYGDLFQWGRCADGHQLRTSDTYAGPVSSATCNGTGQAWNGEFVTLSSDWLSTPNNDLWQGVDGTNNPCPSGWRVPTETEWVAEAENWEPKNYYGAFASPLRLTVGGLRSLNDGHVIDGMAVYWGDSKQGSLGFRIDARVNFLGWGYLAYAGHGASVRCIKD